MEDKKIEKNLKKMQKSLKKRKNNEFSTSEKT